MERNQTENLPTDFDNSQPQNGPINTHDEPIITQVSRNNETPREQNNSEPHEPVFPNSPVKNSTSEVTDTKFKGYPVRSEQMQMRMRKQRELEKMAQLRARESVSSHLESSEEIPTPPTQTITTKSKVHFADEIPSLPNENLENTPRINTISLMSEANFVRPTDVNVASTEWEQAEIATIDFETEIPENIVFEEAQIVFEEPCVSYKEIQTEIEKTRTVTDEKKSRLHETTRNPSVILSQKKTP